MCVGMYKCMQCIHLYCSLHHLQSAILLGIVDKACWAYRCKVGSPAASSYPPARYGCVQSLNPLLQHREEEEQQEEEEEVEEEGEEEEQQQQEEEEEVEEEGEDDDKLNHHEIIMKSLKGSNLI